MQRIDAIIELISDCSVNGHNTYWQESRDDQTIRTSQTKQTSLSTRLCLLADIGTDPEVGKQTAFGVTFDPLIIYSHRVGWAFPQVCVRASVYGRIVCKRFIREYMQPCMHMHVQTHTHIHDVYHRHASTQINAPEVETDFQMLRKSIIRKMSPTKRF